MLASREAAGHMWLLGILNVTIETEKPNFELNWNMLQVKKPHQVSKSI